MEYSKKNYKFRIACRKGKNGLYKCLEIDMGYDVKKVFLSREQSVLYLELANITPHDFAKMNEGDIIELN